jgi:orotidine-5'-phosphate decarboxylase
MTDRPAPIAVALDAPSLDVAVRLAREVEPFVSTLKVGLELYLRSGPEGVAAIRQAAPSCQLFLDLKLHDIPNTVAGAVRSVIALRPAILTVHASGGSKMVAAAVGEAPDVVIAAVTVLTSLDASDLEAQGVSGSPADAVRRLAVLAVSAGARALVCSPQEVALLRAELDRDVLLITPGVRPLASEMGDQSRVATPQQALSDGADLLVIGRPITAAERPAEAAEQIAASLNA